MDYHFVYKDVEGTSTEWDDIQRKLGNLPPKPAPFKPPPFSPSVDDSSKPKDKSWIDDKTEEELEDLEDDRNLDDDRFLEEYRKKRLAEMRETARVSRFGSVVPITGADFVREVSQAPSDVWVVVFLYKDGILECGVLSECLDELATRYPATKFVKIISTDCIPNYPDRNLPTLLVYNNGAVKATYVGLHHFGPRRCTAEGLKGCVRIKVSCGGEVEISLKIPAHHVWIVDCQCVGFPPKKTHPKTGWFKFCSKAVALTLCQSDPVLNDGQSGRNTSNKAVIDGVSKRFIEKVLSEHEDEDEYSSD